MGNVVAALALVVALLALVVMAHLVDAIRSLQAEVRAHKPAPEADRVGIVVEVAAQQVANALRPLHGYAAHQHGLLLHVYRFADWWFRLSQVHAEQLVERLYEGLVRADGARHCVEGDECGPPGGGCTCSCRACTRCQRLWRVAEEAVRAAPAALRAEAPVASAAGAAKDGPAVGVPSPAGASRAAPTSSPTLPSNAGVPS